MTEGRGKGEDEITEDLITKSHLKKSDGDASADAKAREKDKNLLIAISAIFLYGITSLAQTVFNKKVLATYPQ